MPSIWEVKEFISCQVLQTPKQPSGDLAGQTIVVTGANTGLGLECAKQLCVVSNANSHLC